MGEERLGGGRPWTFPPPGEAEQGTVLAYPPGSSTAGRAAIRAVCEEMLRHVPRFELEPLIPTVVNGDLALTGTRSADGRGGRVQVARRQPDGSWLRVIDRPEQD